MFHRLLPSTRILMLIPFAGSLAAAVLLTVYASVRLVQLFGETFSTLQQASAKGGKLLALASIEIVDLFLLGAALFIVALGLYELFIDDRLELPAWLVIHDLDDLKSKLINVIVLIMGVLFLGQAVNWDGERELLGFGGALALVIAALTYFKSQKTVKE